MSFFQAAFEIVVGLEGNYSNDPADPGGETKFGISKRAYPNVDIPQLTVEQAQGIYRRDYWNALDCDSMPWERALCVFDAGVNQGVGYARTLPADAIDLMATRAVRYAGTAHFDRFGRGWMRRLFTIFGKSRVTP